MQQNKTVPYEQIIPADQTATRDDLELQPNTAYGTSHKVTIDTNPAYESYMQVNVTTSLFTQSI